MAYFCLGLLVGMFLKEPVMELGGALKKLILENLK